MVKKSKTNNKKYLWDTGALFLFFGGHRKAKTIMTEIENNDAIGYIPKLVLVEFYYKTMEKLGKITANYQLLLLKESKNIIIDFEENDIEKIGKIKLNYRDLSFVDSVIYTLGLSLNATIITTDSDFQKPGKVKSIKLEY